MRVSSLFDLLLWRETALFVYACFFFFFFCILFLDEDEGDNWSDGSHRSGLRSSKRTRAVSDDSLEELFPSDHAGESPEGTPHRPGTPPHQHSNDQDDHARLGRFLDNLLSEVGSAGQYTDIELFDGSYRALRDHLVWFVRERKHTQVLSQQNSVRLNQLEVQGVDMQQLRMEIASLKDEKEKWASSAETISELEAAKLTLEDQLLKVKAVANERDSVISAKDDLIANLNIQLNQKDGQILGQASEIATHTTSLRELKEQLEAEVAAKGFLANELEKLHSGLEVIGMNVLKDPMVTEPFSAYAEGLKEYGSHRAAVMAQKLLFSEEPSNMPPELSQLIVPDCRDKVRELYENTRQARSGYLSKLVSMKNASVDEILAVQP